MTSHIEQVSTAAYDEGCFPLCNASVDSWDPLYVSRAEDDGWTESTSTKSRAVGTHNEVFGSSLLLVSI